MNASPLILIAYNRPNHLIKVLDALQKNSLIKETILYIYIDGLRKNASRGEMYNRNNVLSIIKHINFSKETIVIERDENYGLEKNITLAINDVLNTFDKVIVLEDDIVPSSFFLRFMNENLEIYKKSDIVFSVCSYMFPINYKEKKNVLLPYFFSWGWGTWKHKWQKFQSIINKEAFKNAHLGSRFNLANYNYVNIINEKDSWAIKWYYTIFIHNGLCVFPTKSLTINIGNDGSGTHSTNEFVLKENFVDYIKSSKEKIIDITFLMNLYEYFDNRKKRLLW